MLLQQLLLARHSRRVGCFKHVCFSTAPCWCFNHPLKVPPETPVPNPSLVFHPQSMHTDDAAKAGKPGTCHSTLPGAQSDIRGRHTTGGRHTSRQWPQQDPQQVPLSLQQHSSSWHQVAACACTQACKQWHRCSSSGRATGLFCRQPSTQAVQKQVRGGPSQHDSSSSGGICSQRRSCGGSERRSGGPRACCHCR